mmetsp:Transcript_11381/g.28272  ORF Transcript_11381/g.28272 Transcript_11381/m.28272 type:complete len:213 (+) Transcript_11381:5476-6114(+)
MLGPSHMASNLPASRPPRTSLRFAAVRLPSWMPMRKPAPWKKSTVTSECWGMGTLAWNVTVMVLRHPGYDVDWLMFLMVNSAVDWAPLVHGPPLTLRGRESVTPQTSTGLLFTSTGSKHSDSTGPSMLPGGLSPRIMSMRGDDCSQPRFLTSKVIVWLASCVSEVKLKDSSPCTLSHMTPSIAVLSSWTTGFMSVCVPVRPLRVILFSGSER